MVKFDEYAVFELDRHTIDRWSLLDTAGGGASYGSQPNSLCDNIACGPDMLCVEINTKCDPPNAMCPGGTPGDNIACPNHVC